MVVSDAYRFYRKVIFILQKCNLSNCADMWNVVEPTLYRTFLSRTTFVLKQGKFTEFMTAQKEAFESGGQIQTLFLNTDAVYLTTYVSLSVLFQRMQRETHTKVRF